jgi:hypothetical protein
MSNNVSDEPKGMGDKIAKLAVVLNWLTLVSWIVFFIFIEGLFWYFRIPLYIKAGLGAVMLLAVALGINWINQSVFMLKMKRYTGNNFEWQSVPLIPQTPLETGEKIIATIPGIGANGMKIRLVNRYGTGYGPENSLIITDRSFVFVYAQLPYGDQVISTTFVRMQNWLWAQKDIEKKLTQLLEGSKLSDIYASYRGNYRIAFSDIETFSASDFTKVFSIKIKTGNFFSYCIRTVDGWNKLKETATSLGLLKNN